MKNITISIEKELRFIKYLVKLKVIDDRIFRDIEIRRGYVELRKQHKAMDARQILADKYFLGLKTIEGIIYNHDKNENTILLTNLKPFRMITVTLKK